MGIGSRDSSARDCSFAHCATRALNLTMPYKGNVVLQKVDSMDVLLRFWNSSCALEFSWTVVCERVLAGGVSR